MRLLTASVLSCALLAASGCGKGKEYDGPTVKEFTGRLTADGKPVKFQGEPKVTLDLFLHEGGQRFGVPLKEDGSFTIGWMPIGKYSATLVREPPPGGRSGPRRHTVPDGLTIEEGKTDYTIDLGKNYKP